MVARETSLRRGLDELDLPFSLEATAIDRLSTLVDLLGRDAMAKGFLGAGETGRIVPRHVLESVALLRFIPRDGHLVDVGSGAGIPGLSLACCRMGPVTLVEPMAKRAAFLRRAVRGLELADVRVRCMRAEDAAAGDLREVCDVGTARALAPLWESMELVLPLVRTGGAAFFLSGPPEPAGRARLVAAALALGGGEPRARRFEVPGLEEPRWVMIVRKLRPTPDRYPRSPTARKRRPLGG